MKYIDAEEIEKRIHEIIDTNLNGVSPEINRRAAALFPVSCINDDGRPFDVNYTHREGFKKGLREAYENVLGIIDSLQQEQPEVELEEYLSAQLFSLGADLIRHKPYSFNRGLNVGMTKAYEDILKKINTRKEE